MFPNFLGIGVMKCGTTTLHKYCRGHPEIYVPFVKESEFLSQRLWDDSMLDEYEHMFMDKFPLRGEFCPSYMYIPDRIKTLFPDTKIVICVRDPIERMISQMRHNSGRPHDPNHSTCAWDEMIKNLELGDIHQTCAMSMYEHYLEPFMSTDYYVVNCNDLTNGYEQTYINFCKFLGVGPHLPNGVVREHVGDEAGRPRIEMSETHREYFRHFFKGTYEWCADVLKVDFRAST